MLDDYKNMYPVNSSEEFHEKVILLVLSKKYKMIQMSPSPSDREKSNINF